VTRRQELEMTIRLHERTLSDPSNINSGFHRDNVETSLRNAREKLARLK